MFPVINLKETGRNIRRIMDIRGISAKDIQEYLNLSSVQSVYNWCNGSNIPTIDRLYALRQLFQLPIDLIVRGNRKEDISELLFENARNHRLFVYYKKINKFLIA